MRKVKLDVHDLHVEAFHTSLVEREPGTVAAYDTAPRPSDLVTNHDTRNNSLDYWTCTCELTVCEQTCAGTCWFTCAGDTCDNTCHTNVCDCNLSDFGTCIC